MDPTEEEEEREKEEERGLDGAGVEERGTGVEAHVGDAVEGMRRRVDTEEGTWWRVDAEGERAPAGVGI
jgi:hypothetical protein